MNPLSSLLGARIRRIDAPEPTLLALTLFTPELRAVLLLRLSGEPVGVGLVTERPQGQPANSFVQKLRKELENARIVGFEQPDPTALALVLARAELTTRLVCDFAQASAFIERDGKTLIRSAARRARPMRGHSIAWPQSIEALRELGSRLIQEQAAQGLDAQRSALARLLRTAHKRLGRRMLALQQDQQRARQAQPLRDRANLLLSQQHLLRRGQSSAQVTDYSVDPPAQVEIALDPTRTAQEQIEGWFKQARRFERGAQLASERSEMTRQQMAQLDALLQRLPQAEGEQLQQIAQHARALGLAGVGRALESRADGAAKPTKHEQRKPYRQFAGWKQRPILVGKSASDNDLLTREHARPQDLWLHARSQAGAHVIVPLERHEICPDELLVDAAHLAAHFSAARGDSSVEISYTARRYVRKPRGGAKGQALLEREKVLLLQLEPSRLARLLSQERND